jgi:hypothetical protein
MKRKALLGALAGGSIALCGSLSAAATGQAAGGPGCDARVAFGVLPVWARAGFSDAQPRIAHVVGRAGRIAAILFGYPLLSPPSTVRANKILWVARSTPSSGSSLRISAQRMDGVRKVGPPVARRVGGGPGPSIINLPAAGCWRFTLRWSDRTDRLDLDYRANR